MEIKLYFQMLRRTWWIVVLTALAAVTASLIVSYLTKPIYRVSSRYLVMPNPSLVSGGGGMLLESLATLDKRSIIQTYAEIIKSPRIYKETLSSLNTNENALIDYSYAAVVLPDANIIELSVTGPNPETDVLLANSIGDHAISFVKTIYQIYDIVVLDPAVLPIDPIRPQPLRDAVIALALGLGVGVALAFLNETLSTTIGNMMQRFTLDDMSSALNRKTFERRLEALTSSTAIPGYLSLCIVEVAGLKEYLDVLPQPTLQQVLRDATTTLKNQLRGNDIFGRWSDYAFAVLLSETPGNAALNTMGRVRVALSVPIRINISGEELYLNPVIGIAEHKIGKSKDDLIKDAELALERAKKGTDGVVLIDSVRKLLYGEGNNLG
jgi:diguanylate cyclase (GGDEF)-like protein